MHINEEIFIHIRSLERLLESYEELTEDIKTNIFWLKENIPPTLAMDEKLQDFGSFFIKNKNIQEDILLTTQKIENYIAA